VASRTGCCMTYVLGQVDAVDAPKKGRGDAARNSLTQPLCWPVGAPQAGILFDLVRLQRQQSVGGSLGRESTLGDGVMWSTSSSR